MTLINARNSQPGTTSRGNPSRCNTGYQRRYRLNLRHAPLALLVSALSLLSLAFASPEEALAYRPPEVAELEALIRQAEGDLGFFQQLGYSASVQPSVTYGDEYDDDEEASFESDFEFGAGVSYRYRPAQTLEQRANIEGVRDDLNDTLRDGVEGALLAHAALLEAQYELRGAEEAYRDVQIGLQAIESQLAESSEALRPLLEQRVAEGRLSFESRTLSLRNAQQEVRTLINEAERYGLSTPATYQPTRFVLPGREVETTSAYRRLSLAVASARTQASLQPLESFREVELSAEYALPDIKAELGVGIYRGDPGANLGVDYPGARSERYELALSAEIILDRNLVRSFGEVERELQEARDELETFQSTYTAELQDAFRSANAAEERLALAEQQFALSESRIQALEETRDALAAELESISEDEEEEERVLERQLRDVERELSRAPNELERNERDLYRTWASYIQTVAGYLAFTENTWAIREP